MSGVDDSDDVRAETARLIRDLLEMVETGVIDASSTDGRRMMLRLEGAVSALEAT